MASGFLTFSISLDCVHDDLTTQRKAVMDITVKLILFFSKLLRSHFGHSRPIPRHKLQGDLHKEPETAAYAANRPRLHSKGGLAVMCILSRCTISRVTLGEENANVNRFWAGLFRAMGRGSRDL